MRTAYRFLLLALALTAVGYGVGGVIERATIPKHMRILMPLSIEIHANDYLSYGFFLTVVCAFALWLLTALAFHLMQRGLRGPMIARSLLCYGILFALFSLVSVSNIVRYDDPSRLHYWRVIDAMILFGVVGVATGLLYRPLLTSGDNQ